MPPTRQAQPCSILREGTNQRRAFDDIPLETGGSGEEFLPFHGCPVCPGRGELSQDYGLPGSVDVKGGVRLKGGLVDAGGGVA